MTNGPDAGGNPELKLILDNRAAAYSGLIGNKRREFCLEYIEKKKNILNQVRARQLTTVLKGGKTISCHQGCTYCCLAYMQANIQECEAIVYYLYNNERALSSFLGNYPVWRERLRQNGDIFMKCGESWLQQCQPEESQEKPAALPDLEAEYRRQNIPCPFLIEGSCSIYEVRPFTCAAIVATTPPEYCSPASANSPNTYVIPAAEVIDNAFYYHAIEGTVLAFMPLAVYAILKDGYRLLAGIPGLEGLDEFSAGAGTGPLTVKKNNQ